MGDSGADRRFGRERRSNNFFGSTSVFRLLSLVDGVLVEMRVVFHLFMSSIAINLYYGCRLDYNK